MRRVGGLLLRLLAGAAIVAASVAAALALLGVDPDPPSADDSDVQTLPGVTSARTEERNAESTATGTRPADTDRDPAPLLAVGAASSWDALESSLPGQIGLAIASLGTGESLSFGSLRSGRAWSTIKVPILVTLLRERDGEGLTAEEEGWATAALTASDNEAAAALFDQIEAAQGGLDGASHAVEGTLRRAGDSATVVTTAPPPSGAVSTYGQTEWSLTASAKFFGALASGCLLGRSETEYVLDLMGEVVPEQQWGLGEASFDPSWQMAIKGGWGPEGSASGPYLVRQSAVLSDGSAGVAVATAAQADSGSFEAGIEALDQISTWLQGNLHTLGQARRTSCQS